MSNYDHDVLGVGNPNHPYNEKEQEIFESDNIQECFDYAKLAYDYEPLEVAIYNQETIIENAVSELHFCIDCLQKNTLVKNRLLAIKRNLMSNQVKL